MGVTRRGLVVSTLVAPFFTNGSVNAQGLSRDADFSLPLNRDAMLITLVRPGAELNLDRIRQFPLEDIRYMRDNLGHRALISQANAIEAMHGTVEALKLQPNHMDTIRDPQYLEGLSPTLRVVIPNVISGQMTRMDAIAHIREEYAKRFDAVNLALTQVLNGPTPASQMLPPRR